MKGKPDEMNSTHIKVNKIIEYRKGSSINDVTLEGEGGGSPQKVTGSDKGEVPYFNQR